MAYSLASSVHYLELYYWAVESACFEIWDLAYVWFMCVLVELAHPFPHWAIPTASWWPMLFIGVPTLMASHPFWIYKHNQLGIALEGVKLIDFSDWLPWSYLSLMASFGLRDSIMLLVPMSLPPLNPLAWESPVNQELYSYSMYLVSLISLPMVSQPSRMLWF